MKVTTYNHHARLLLPSPWSLAATSVFGLREPTLS
jgi:hypothetical protein